MSSTSVIVLTFSATWKRSMPSFSILLTRFISPIMDFWNIGRHSSNPFVSVCIWSISACPASAQSNIQCRETVCKNGNVFKSLFLYSIIARVCSVGACPPVSTGSFSKQSRTTALPEYNIANAVTHVLSYIVPSSTPNTSSLTLSPRAKSVYILTKCLSLRNWGYINPRLAVTSPMYSYR